MGRASDEQIAQLTPIIEKLRAEKGSASLLCAHHRLLSENLWAKWQFTNVSALSLHCNPAAQAICAVHTSEWLGYYITLFEFHLWRDYKQRFRTSKARDACYVEYSAGGTDRGCIVTILITKENREGQKSLSRSSFFTLSWQTSMAHVIVSLTTSPLYNAQNRF